MEDELELLNMVVNEDVQGETLSNPQGRLEELTPQIQRSTPVVDRTERSGRNRLTGVSNFLANPEVQFAIAEFGRAFAGNQPGQAGTILADAAQATIAGRANRDALEAAESGGNIAEAGGRFADPNLIAGLQERRTAAELSQARLGLDERQLEESVRQFDLDLGLQERVQDLRELGADRDFVLQNARLNLDRETFEARVDQLETENALNERIADSEIEYRNWLMTQEAQGQSENFALRTNEFIELLSEQQSNYRQQASLIQNELNKLGDEAWLLRWRNRPGASRVQQGGRAAASQGVRPEDPQGFSEVKGALENALTRVQDKTQAIQSQIDLLEAVQASRLGAAPGGTGARAMEGAEDEAGNVRGSQENPTVVTSPGQLRGQPDGFYKLGNQVYQKQGDNLIPVTDRATEE